MLDAKTVALSQADRLLSQYKGKMTASDLEVKNIKTDSISFVNMILVFLLVGENKIIHARNREGL